MEGTTSLGSLPNEVLSLVVSSFDHARSLRNLSLTCRRLRDFVRADGWHSFVTSHFPLYEGPPLWCDAAHSLTSLSKSWDKRALNAKFILPQKDINVQHVRRRLHRRSSSAGANEVDIRHAAQTNARPPQRDRNRRPVGQTMGYQPVIDCAEHWSGNSWTDREEILAVGAGAEVLIRHQTIGKADSDIGIEGLSLEENITTTDDHGNKSYWRSWRDERFMDGKDDVSTLKLLNGARTVAHQTEAIVGRVNGSLERVRIGDRVSKVAEFDTSSRPVRAMNLSSQEDGFLAVCLGNKDVALYRLDDDAELIAPVHKFSALCEGRQARTWAARFLGPERLAIGHGMSQQPLDIYDVRPEGVSEAPVRRFPAIRENLYAPNVNTTPPSDAVYSIGPLPDGNRSTNDPTQVFATGWYSGAIRLHDLRSPEAAVMTFADPLEAGAAVYSVLPISMDRIVAGTALHAKMQVFDLRRNNPESYVAPGVTKPSQSGGGYSLFLARDYKSSRKESSVYSLAMSSPFSSRLYAGLEGSVLQIDMFSSVDKHPDPVYLPSPDSRIRNHRERFYASLAMMDYSGSSKLWIQRHFGRRRDGKWDDRWLELT